MLLQDDEVDAPKPENCFGKSFEPSESRWRCGSYDLEETWTHGQGGQVGDLGKSTLVEEDSLEDRVLGDGLTKAEPHQEQDDLQDVRAWDLHDGQRRLR